MASCINYREMEEIKNSLSLDSELKILITLPMILLHVGKKGQGAIKGSVKAEGTGKVSAQRHNAPGLRTPRSTHALLDRKPQLRLMLL